MEELLKKMQEDFDCFMKDCEEFVKQQKKKQKEKPEEMATDEDIGKMCWFWDFNGDCYKRVGVLNEIEYDKNDIHYVTELGNWYSKCRRLTKEEIEKYI